MTDNVRDPRDIEKLDLARYGLAYLDGSNLLALDEPDMDKLLKALGEDDISLNIPIPCTPYNVFKILEYSHCRNCGRCCIPNPLNQTNPGVEAFESELKTIAEHTKMPWKTLKEKTLKGKVGIHPFEQDKFSYTRWLPLPCPYHDAEKGACRIYPVRPIVCSIHPVVFTEDNTQISIKCNCDYGKDLIKAAFKDVRTNSPEMVIRL